MMGHFNVNCFKSIFTVGSIASTMLFKGSEMSRDLRILSTRSSNENSPDEVGPSVLKIGASGVFDVPGSGGKSWLKLLLRKPGGVDFSCFPPLRDLGKLVWGSCSPTFRKGMRLRFREEFSGKLKEVPSSTNQSQTRHLTKEKRDFGLWSMAWLS